MPISPYLKGDIGASAHAADVSPSRHSVARERPAASLLPTGPLAIAVDACAVSLIASHRKANSDVPPPTADAGAAPHSRKLIKHDSARVRTACEREGRRVRDRLRAAGAGY